MPMFKSAKNAHNGCYNIWRYLTEKDRSEASAQFNIDTDKDRWYLEMDRLRKAYGNNKNYNGSKAVTYRHCVLSPDPKDNATVEQVLELAKRWAKENFAEYQVAIEVHIDNGIPHAHVVINNTNIITGKRLWISEKRNRETLPNSVQRIAREMGLSPLPDLIMEKGKGKSKDKGDGKHHVSQKENPSRTSQHTKRKLGEDKIHREGRLSWKEEIRLAIIQISKAANGPLTFEQFRAEMQARGFDVWKTKRGGYTYQHYSEIPNSETHEHWKCKDIKLGFAYTPEGMANFYNIGAEQPGVQELFKKAERRHILAYNEYLSKRTELLSDLTLQDRIDTLSFMDDTGVQTLAQMADYKIQLNQRLHEIDKQTARLSKQIAREQQLNDTITTYLENKQFYNKAQQFAEGGTVSNLVYSRYVKTHAKELADFDNALGILQSVGADSEESIAKLAARHQDRLTQMENLKQQRADAQNLLQRTESAQHVVSRIGEADKQAREITSKYVYKTNDKNYAARVRKKVEVREADSRDGKQRYSVRYTKEVDVRRAAAANTYAARKQSEAAARRAQEEAARQTQTTQQQEKQSKQR